VVGLGIVASDLLCFEDFVVSLFSGTSHLSKNEKDELLGLCKKIDLPLMEIKFPPNDLKQTLPQQLMILRAAREALREVKNIDNERQVLILECKLIQLVHFMV